ncbi:MAG TPA: hypothetical protein VF868_05410 [Bacteroidia bacterium]|jgi:hypothetical protein
MSDYPDCIQLKDLHKDAALTTRAFNLCLLLMIKDTKELSKYISKYKSFSNVRACGYKTNKELLLLNRTLTPERIHLYFHERAEREGYKSGLDFITTFELKFKSKLGARAQKALLSYFDNKIPNEDQIAEELICTKLNISKLRNIGIKTSTEINNFIREISDDYNEMIISNIQ